MTTATINLNALGIAQLNNAIEVGMADVSEVFAVVQARIDKRTAEKRSQLKPVIEFRNQLANLLSMTGNTPVIPVMPLPTYHTKVQPNAALPTNPDELADVIVATVGIANLGSVITRLTARILGSN